MATMVVFDDWWVDLVHLSTYDAGPSKRMPGATRIGVRFQVRLYHQSRAVSLASCNARASDEKSSTEFTWLQPAAEASFTHTAKQQFAAGWMRGEYTDDDVRGEFLYMLIQEAAELRRFPGFAGVGVTAIKPAPPSEFPAGHDPGTYELDGEEHHLNGWVDGELLYVDPLGRTLRLREKPQLLEQILRLCAAEVGNA